MRILFYLACALVGLHIGGCIHNLANAKTITLNSQNVIVFETPFTSETTAKLSYKALSKDLAKGLNGPMYLVLDTPGGSVDAGIEMIYNLNQLNSGIHTISLFAASMGFHTVQGVKGKRYITQDGTLMSHKARGGFQGEFPGQLDKRYNLYKDRLLRLDKQVVKRTKGKQTLSSYSALYENEYWCDGQKCVDDGFADEVVSVRCDKSLAGKRRIKYRSMRMFGSVIDFFLIKSKCPIITGPLGLQVYVDGKPINKALKAIKSIELRLQLQKLIQEKREEIENKKKDVTR